METQTWRKGDIVGDGRFEIIKQLGRGGFGVTYLAYDNNKKRQIAIKTVNSDQQEKADFTKIQEKLWDEGFTLRGFPHRHIVRVYENVIIDGWLGFVMEYVLGQNLEKYVEANGHLIESEALRYIDQISQALDFVHQDKVFHRDVNPRNIMLRQDSQEAVLIDFGLAREFVELEPIYLSNTHGSELYKPVEQYEKRGIFGPPLDIYALAVTLYFLLNGAPLGSGKNWTAFISPSRKVNYERGLGKKSDGELWAELINKGVSAKTLIAIQVGMAIEPEDRPKNMMEFRELLGLLPAATPLPEIPALSFPEPLVKAKTVSDPPASLVVVAPITENPPPGLTASIPTKSRTTKDVPDLPQSAMQPVVTIAKKENASPGLTASISPPAKPTENSKKEDVKKKIVTGQSIGVQGDRSRVPRPPSRSIQRPVKNHSTQSLFNRRLFLLGLLGSGGLTGFGLVGLLIRNLFAPQYSSGSLKNNPPEPQSSTESSFPEPNLTPSVKSDTSLHLKTIQFTTVKLDTKGKIIARLKGTAQAYEEKLDVGISIKMVKIPAGSFMMGSPVGEKGSRDSERPQHLVNVKAFYLGQTKITQAQYQEIMGGNPSKFRGDKLPVEQVPWGDAKEFCRKLSEKTGCTYGLPSESQWEYACRAGTTTPFYFGETITTFVANFDDYWRSYRDEVTGFQRDKKGGKNNGVYGNEGKEKTTEASIFPPNSFGLFDMHGNVNEWCEDTWHQDYQGKPVDGSAWDTGSSLKYYSRDNQLVGLPDRVVRGASIYNQPEDCRSASRGASSVGSSIDNPIGFRVICTIV